MFGEGLVKASEEAAVVGRRRRRGGGGFNNPETADLRGYSDIGLTESSKSPEFFVEIQWKAEIIIEYSSRNY